MTPPFDRGPLDFLRQAEAILSAAVATSSIWDLAQKVDGVADNQIDNGGDRLPGPVAEVVGIGLA